MRSAPPVLVPVGRFVWARRMVLALAGATGLTLGLAAVLSDASSAQAAIWLGIWAVATVLAWRWSASDMLPEGLLSWDGEAWQYQSSQSSVPCHVGVALLWDAGPALLLRVRTPATPMAQEQERVDGHAWLTAARLPMQWHGLRCAVHALDTL